MARRKTQIFSVFNECTAAAAQVLIDEGKANKIERDRIPPGELVDKQGRTALFAVVVPGELIARFEQLCREMYA